MRCISTCVATVLLALTGPATVLAQADGDPGRGLAYARATCAGCHGVEANDRYSPRMGVAAFTVIANTPGMTGTAVSVWLRTPHLSMPNLVIEPRDRADVIAYIVSLREAPLGK